MTERTLKAAGPPPLAVTEAIEPDEETAEPWYVVRIVAPPGVDAFADIIARAGPVRANLTVAEVPERLRHHLRQSATDIAHALLAEVGRG